MQWTRKASVRGSCGGHPPQADAVTPQYAAFSDESRHTEGTFRSITAVSRPAACVIAVSDRMRALLRKRGVRESKWHDLTSQRRPSRPV